MIGILITVFVVAFLILFLGNLFHPKYYRFLAVFPLILFLYFGYFLINLQKESSLLLHYKWIPSLGINLDFKLDGFSLLFSLRITGLGTLIFFYASDYLKKAHCLNRLDCYLRLSLGALLGL